MQGDFSEKGSLRAELDVQRHKRQEAEDALADANKLHQQAAQVSC